MSAWRFLRRWYTSTHPQFPLRFPSSLSNYPFPFLSNFLPPLCPSIFYPFLQESSSKSFPNRIPEIGPFSLQFNSQIRE